MTTLRRFHFRRILVTVFKFCLVLLGTLKPKQKQEVAITFMSDEAKVIIATIIVKLAEGATEVTRVIKVSAIGKYPFITLDC